MLSNHKKSQDLIKALTLIGLSSLLMSCGKAELKGTYRGRETITQGTSGQNSNQSGYQNQAITNPSASIVISSDDEDDISGDYRGAIQGRIEGESDGDGSYKIRVISNGSGNQGYSNNTAFGGFQGSSSVSSYISCFASFLEGTLKLGGDDDKDLTGTLRSMNTGGMQQGCSLRIDLDLRKQGDD